MVSTDEDETGAIVLVSTDDDVAIGVASDDEAVIGAADEDGAIGAADEDEATGAAEDETGATELDAGATGAVVPPRLKIQIRPMITITATMMIIQVLRFMG